VTTKNRDWLSTGANAMQIAAIAASFVTYLFGLDKPWVIVAAVAVAAFFAAVGFVYLVIKELDVPHGRASISLAVVVLMGASLFAGVHVLSGHTAAGYSSADVVLDRRDSVPRCNAELTGLAPAGDQAVWVAHTEVGEDRYYFTRADREDLGSTRWAATLIVGEDPGAGGVDVRGPEYEFVAFTANDAGDAFLSGRGYAGTESVSGLVYFGSLPPGVTVANRLTVVRQPGPSGDCPEN